MFAIAKDIIPAERLNAHLDNLGQQLLAMASLSAADGSGLREHAHDVISKAGMLGLMRLCQRARALENACAAGNGAAVALSECCDSAADIWRYAIPAAES